MRRGAAIDAREGLAWLSKRSGNIIVIPGTASAGHLRENLSAWDLV